MPDENRHNPVLSWLHKNKFYSSTPIGGFNFIDKSKSKYEIIIWYIVLFAFAGLTVYNVYKLVKGYAEQETTTKVQVLITNETFPKIPDLFVKLEFPSVCFFLPYIKKVFAANKTKQNLIVQEYPKWLNEDTICRSLRNATSSLLNFNTRESFLNKTLNSLEVFMIMSLVSPPAGDKDDLCRILQRQKSKKFLQFIAKYNISINEISEKILAINKSWIYNVFIDTGHSFAEVTPLFFNGFWTENTKMIRLFYKIHFNTPTNYFEIRVAEKGNTFEKFFVEENMLHLSLDHVDNSAHVDAAFGENVRVFMRVNGIFNFSQKHCREKSETIEEMLDCFGRCLMLLAQQQCECNLFRSGFDFLDDKLPICLFHQMKKCNLTLKSLRTFFEICDGQCDHYDGQKMDCQSIFYQSTIKTDKYLSSRNTTIIYKMHVSERYYYPFFNEQEAQSFISFMGELGGVFDFWLGASVIGLVHMLVYIVKQIVNGFRNNTKTRYAVKAMLGSFEPSAVIVPGGMMPTECIVKNEISESYLRKDIKSIKKQKNFNALCSIVESQRDQIQLLFNQLNDFKETFEKRGH